MKVIDKCDNGLAKRLRSIVMKKAFFWRWKPVKMKRMIFSER